MVKNHGRMLRPCQECTWMFTHKYPSLSCRPHTVPMLYEDGHTSKDFSISCEVAHDFGTFNLSNNMFTRVMLESTRCHKNCIRLYKIHVRLGSSHARYDWNNTRTYHGACTASRSHLNTIVNIHRQMGVGIR